MQDIQKLLEEAQKLNKKKTPQQLLAEAQEYIDGRKYGRKGKDGQDADEDKITQRVLAIVLAQLPKKEELKGEKGDTPTIDYKSIINAVVSQIKPIKGDKGDTPIIDYNSIVSQVTQAIKLPEIDLNSLSIDVVTMIESFEGDDKLDVLKLKNLDKLPKQDIEIDSSKVKGLQELINKLIPKFPPEYAGGSGATFLKSMRDVDLNGLQDGYVLKWNASERKWKPRVDNDAQNLQSVTDNGATTTNTITVPSIQFDTTAGVTVGEGEIAWNATDETLDLGMPDGITLQLGQENQIKVRNSTGSTITNGKVVYVSGVLGNRPQITLAQGNSHATGHIIGLTTQDIANNADGKVTTNGYVREIDTTGTPYGETWADGDTLWLSKTIAGGLTNTEPAVPHHSATVGVVTRAHATQGSILVNITQHQRLENLSDVNGTPLTTTGQIPVWNQTSGYFDFTSNIGDYWKRDGTSIATADWSIGSFAFTANALKTMSLQTTSGASLPIKDFLGSTMATISSNGNTFSGVIQSQAGSVTTPTFSFTGDTNTGMYSTGADGIGFSTGGTNRVTIDSSGFVTFRDTNTAGFQFTNTLSQPVINFQYGGNTRSFIRGGGGSGYDLFFGTNGSIRMAIDSAGNVGFGVFSPTNIATAMHLVNTAPTLTLEHPSANATNAGTIVMRTPGGAESFTQTFNASTNRFHMLYGATNIVNITSTGFGLSTTAFSPSFLFDLISTGSTQHRIGYSISQYLSTTVSSGGQVAFNIVGTVPVYQYKFNGTQKYAIAESSVELINSSVSSVSYLAQNNDTGILLSAGYNTGSEIGTYSINGDEAIAAYDYLLNQYYYFNRAFTGSDSAITSYASFDIQSSLQVDSIVNDTGLAAGTYTPTLTNVTNVAASTAYECQYLRVGNTVTVSGKVDIDQTAAGAYEVGISLPIASNFGADEDCAGVGVSVNVGPSDAPYVKADATNNRASFNGNDTDVSNHSHYFSFTYQVI